MLCGAAGLLALYLAVHAVMSLVGWRLLSGTEPVRGLAAELVIPSRPLDSSAAPAEAERLQREHMRDRLDGHNPFCPGCADPPPTAAGPGVTPPPGVELLAPGERETELPLTLVATMEATPPGRSLATISYEGTTGLFAEGDQLLEGVQLLAVDTGAVHLRVGQAVELLRMAADDRSKRRPKDREDREPTTRDRPPSRYELPGARDAIDCQGNACTVDRRFVAELMANPALLTRQGRASPYARDGLEGFRLSRVRRGTIPRLLGLRSGDVVTSVNGQPLASLDGAMRLYARLRNASHLTVEFVRSRRGKRKPMRIDIDVV